MDDSSLLEGDPWDAALLEAVHPADWEAPQPPGRYAMVVIGAGTAGLVAAAGAAGLGARVALVERGLMGGDCLNFGCVPSKALLAAARAARAARGGADFGVTGTASVDFAAVMERMRRLRAGIAPHDSAARFAELGVDVFFGEARFAGEDAVAVTTGEGETTLRFHRAVIATGARAAVPPIPGLDGVDYLTNETLFALTELPGHLLVIGAGVIGCELAQAFRSFGAAVTVIDQADRVLPAEDPDASAILGARLEAEGVRLVLGQGVTEVEARGGGLALRVGDEVLTGDALLVATGRSPNTQGLDLVAAGVAYGRLGISVDDGLQTTNPRIYAAGDVATHQRFTHAAEAMARIAIRNAFFPGTQRMSALVIPRCTYTDPEIAHAGMTAAEAAAAGDAVRSFTFWMRDLDRAILDGETEGFARAHVDSRRGTVLGATMVGAHAGEALGIMTLAIRKGMSLAELDATIQPYPTRAEAWKRLGGAWNRSRFTPGLAKAAGWFLGRYTEG